MFQPDERQITIGIRREDENQQSINDIYTIEVPFHTNEIRIKCIKGAAHVLLRRAPSTPMPAITPPPQSEVSYNNLENTNNTNNGNSNNIANTAEQTQEHGIDHPAASSLVVSTPAAQQSSKTC